MCKSTCETNQKLFELTTENKAMLQFIEEAGLIGAWLDNKDMYLAENEGE